jgi:membrane fusion protein (multidrug efflux system)
MPDGSSADVGHPRASGRERALPISRVVVGAVVVTAAIAVGAKVIAQRHDVTTDEAVVVARTVTLAPEITARATQVLVKNHQLIERGALLLELDPTVFEQSLAKARGELHVAEAQEREAELHLEAVQRQHPVRLQVAREDQAEAIATRQSLEAEIKRVEAQAASVEAALTLARQEAGRARVLQQAGSLASAQLEQQVARVAQLEAEQHSLAAQRAAATSRGVAAAGAARSAGGRASMISDDVEPALAESARALAHARVEQATASVALAEAELARTKIVAPIRGVVEHLEVEVGMLVASQTPALSIVSSDDVWIDARVKETEIHRIQPEQVARIRVDALGSEDLFGHVDGVGFATLSRFAAIPIEATGTHFVRVTQRVPVRIRLDGHHDAMRAGLSAVVTIKGGT